MPRNPADFWAAVSAIVALLTLLGGVAVWFGPKLFAVTRRSRNAKTQMLVSIAGLNLAKEAVARIRERGLDDIEAKASTEVACQSLKSASDVVCADMYDDFKNGIDPKSRHYLGHQLQRVEYALRSLAEPASANTTPQVDIVCTSTLDQITRTESFLQRTGLRLGEYGVGFKRGDSPHLKRFLVPIREASRPSASWWLSFPNLRVLGWTLRRRWQHRRGSR